MLTRRVVRGLAFLIILVSVPVFAIRRPDTGSSMNGFFSSCQTIPNPGTCPFVSAEGTATLSGTDATWNAVTVTIALYNWGSYPCSNEMCTPVINFAVLDVKLTGISGQGIESLVVKGVLSNPSYVSCGDISFLNPGIGCTYYSGEANMPEPTPIAGADNTSTRWDFGGVPPSNPPAPAVPFDDLSCESDSKTNICSSAYDEAILVVSNSVAQNHLNTASSDYLVTLIDGTKLGTLVVPASPTKQAVNNTQATETVIASPSYKDYTDTSQTYPQIDEHGNPVYPNGFALAPLPPPSSPTLPSCYPMNEVTGLPDTRTFRTVWYSYTAPANGSITINTAGSRYDTLLYVFAGSASEPTTVSCDDDPLNGSLLQAVSTFNATQGTNYQIVVYETPPFPTNTYYGYPLSVDGTLYFSLDFTTLPPTSVTTITSSPKTSVYGQTVEFSAVVTAIRPGTPTGTVTFSEGSTILGASSLNGGRAYIYGVPLAEGANLITASYSGDSDFNGSASSLGQAVTQATTTLAVSSSQGKSASGQPVTFTAIVKPEYSGQASGMVTFNDGGTALGAAPLNGNTAILTTSALNTGTNSITAMYNGDSNFNGSTSKALSQVVNYGSTTTVVTSPNPSTLGSPVSITVTVTSPVGTPTGSVEIQYGFGVTTQYLKSGSVSYTTSVLTVGQMGITASYKGTSNITGSSSTPFYQVVMFPPNYNILYSFEGFLYQNPDGANPFAGVIQDANGNLYGTTESGGTGVSGTVFELPSTGPEMVLSSFPLLYNVDISPSGLVRDANGNLYGTTQYGGVNECGTVFEVSASGEQLVLYTFTCGLDGGFPVGGLVRDANGNLYGTTSYFGANGDGTVFEVTGLNQEMVLYNFAGGLDGATPEAGLLMDANGDMYGTTQYGGPNDRGTVFKLSEVNSTWQETVLYSFIGVGGDGAFPVASLVLDANNNVYGTTEYAGDLECAGGGGQGCGMVFKVTPAGTESILYDFTGGVHGANPIAGLVRDAQGNLYGTTKAGGLFGLGTVFKVATTRKETVLYSFSGWPDGAVPAAALILDAKGNLYGTTTTGGAYYYGNYGTVFELMPPY
jgi:uncharacterized repeat protein (TIGR03803 family)